MDVVGHHAPRVNGHAGRGGVAAEDIDSGGGHGRTAKDWRAALHGDGDRTDHADFGKDLRREPDASPRRVLFGHEEFMVSRPTAGTSPRPTDGRRGDKLHPTVSAMGEN